MGAVDLGKRFCDGLKTSNFLSKANGPGDHTPTISIRIDNTTKLPRKCWEGQVYKITRRTEKVWFDFNLDRGIPCPQKYLGYPEGWYEIRPHDCSRRR